MKKYLIFDLDGTLISSTAFIKREIFDYFKNNYSEYLDKLYYSLDYNSVGDLSELVNFIFGQDFPEEEIIKIKKDLYRLINEQVDNIGFISGTIETILKLNNNFTLFLSTGNSTKFAKEMLSKGGIIDCFEMIIGGDLIPKTAEHVEMMKDHMCDENFYRDAVFIGDGPRDRQISEEKGITYIRIGDGIIDSIEQIDFSCL